MYLPTLKDISPTEGLDLDEKSALEDLFGFTQEQISRLCFQNPHRYETNLKWIGPKAFAYYLPAVVPYLRSSASTGDSDIVNCLVGTVESRLQFDPRSVQMAQDSVLNILNYCVVHHSKFAVSREIYGDLEGKLRGLIQRVEAMQPYPG